MTETSIEGILNADEPAVEVETPTPPRDEAGRFAAKGEEQALEPVEGASPAPEVAEQPVLDHPALLGERRRRQESDQRVAESDQRVAILERQIADLQSQQPVIQPVQPPEAPDPWEDPMGFADWTSKRSVEAAMQNLTPMIEQRFAQQRVQASFAQASTKYPDFQERWDAFAAMEETNPALTQVALQQPDPAEYAYRVAKNFEMAKQMGALDVDALKAKLREEIMAEEVAKLPNLPTTLATLRSVGTRGGPEWSGPRSMSDILS